MTTLPSPDRPARALGLSVEPVTGPVVLSAVPDQPRLDSVTGREPAADLNSAYPDTSYAEIPARGYSDRDTGDHRAQDYSAREDRTAAVIRSAAAVEALVGLWLAVSPWVVGSGGSAVLRWNDVVVGTALAIVAGARLVRPSLPRTPWISFGLGAWTIVAAFVLSFQNGATGTAPLWNAIVCGAALTGAAAWSTTETERATLRRG